MPELPEVETIKNAIQNTLKNAKFLDIVIYNPNLRQKVSDNLPSQIKNQKIIGYQRVAKYIVIHLKINFPLFCIWE